MGQGNESYLNVLAHMSSVRNKDKKMRPFFEDRIYWLLSDWKCTGSLADQIDFGQPSSEIVQKMANSWLLFVAMQKCVIPPLGIYNQWLHLVRVMFTTTSMTTLYNIYFYTYWSKCSHDSHNIDLLIKTQNNSVLLSH